MKTAIFIMNGRSVELFVDDEGRPLITMQRKRGGGMAGTNPSTSLPGQKQFENGSDFNFEDSQLYQFEAL